MTIGRNDLCPCGSGKKYKKCCAKKDDIDKRVSTQPRQVQEVLDPETSIYKVWQEWRKAREIADFNFLYDLLVSSGPLVQQYPDRATFIAACAEGTARIPHGIPASFRHLSIVEGKTARLLQTLGDREASSLTITCECISLVRTESGWRFLDVQVKTLAKADHPTISFAVFDGEASSVLPPGEVVGVEADAVSDGPPVVE